MPTKPTDEPDDQTVFLAWASLVHAGQFLPAGLSDSLQAFAGVTLAEQDLLAQLGRSREGIKMSELAERLFFSKAGMTKMVDRLEDQHLVERRSHPSDRRATVIHLTPGGRKQLRKAQETLRQWVTANFKARLTTTQLRQLSSALKALLQSHGRWEPQRRHLGLNAEEERG